MSEVIRENEGAVEIKTLKKPKSSTVVDSSTRVSDDFEGVASLNDGGTLKERPPSTREVKKTVLGNAGPDASGAIDWSKNPDCVDYILQKHESSGNPDNAEGYLQTAAKCTNQFNKLFKSRVTAEGIADALKHYNTPGAKATVAAKSPTAAAVPQKAAEPVENFYPFAGEELYVENRKDVVQLSGTKFEICKILNCHNICVAPVTRGTADENGTFRAVCKASANNEVVKSQCPQEADLSAKEQFAYEMYLSQFNGDTLKAKKFLYMSKALYADEKQQKKRK